MNSSSTTATVDMLSPQVPPDANPCPPIAAKHAAAGTDAANAAKASSTEVLSLCMEQSACGC